MSHHKHAIMGMASTHKRLMMINLFIGLGLIINSERLASVGEMAARITHEIRNPLNTIKMNSDYLLENIGKTESEEKKQLLSLVVKEVERLEQITNKYMGMVNYRRNEAVETGVSIPSDLVDFLSFHQPELQKRNIELTFEKEGQFVLSIEGNPIRSADR